MNSRFDPLSMSISPNSTSTGKTIAEVAHRDPSLTDLTIVGDPATGVSGSATIADLAALIAPPSSLLPAINPGSVGQILTIGGGLDPEWRDASQEVPAFLPTDGGKHLTVKADGTAVEWATAIGGGMPPVAVADAGKVLTVKTDGTGAEWAPAPTNDLLANLLDVQMSYTDTHHPGGLPVNGQSLIWSERTHNTDPGSPTTGVWRPGNPNPQLHEWSGVKDYAEHDVVYHKGRLWTATHITKKNRGIEPDIKDGECVAIWTDSRGVGSGPRLIEHVSNVSDINTPPADLTLPAGTTVFSRTVYLQYSNDQTWSLWDWSSTVVGGAWVWGWHRVDTSGGSTVWRNVALPSPSSTPKSATLWIYGLQNHTHAPIASIAGWQPIALGDFLVSMADVVATNAKSGDVLVSDGAGRWHAQTNNAIPAYTVAEAGKVLSVKSDGTGAEWHTVSGFTDNIAFKYMGNTGPFKSNVFVSGMVNDVTSSWVKSSSIEMNGMIVADAIILQGSNALTSFSMRSLVISVGNISFNRCPNVTEINLQSIQKIGGNLNINGGNMTVLEFPRLNAVRELDIAWCPEVTRIVLGNLEQVAGYFSISGCPKLTEVTFPTGRAILTTIQGDFYLSGCALPEAQINKVLATLVAMNGKNGSILYGPGRTIDLSGGTNAAPTGQGIIDAQTLMARGATVTVNGPAITTTRHYPYPVEFDSATDTGKVLSVKADGSGAEWKTASGLPSILSTDKGKYLVSKADGSGAEWHTISDMDFDISDLANTATDLDSNLFLVGKYYDSLSDKTKCKNVTLNALLAASSLQVEYSNTIETFTAKSLANAYGGIIGFSTCPKLKSVSFPSLKNAYGTLKAESCPALTSFAVNPINAYEISVRDNPKLTAFNLYAIESAGSITVANNPLLVDFGFGGVLKSLDRNFNGTGNGFNANTVNGILAALAKLDGTKGTSVFGVGQTVDLSGGTNAAPTGQGIIDAQKIIARGGTVIVNGTAITTTKRLVHAPEFDTVADPGKVLSVKADGTGAEWMPAGGAPAYAAADAGHTLAVNMDGTGLEWQPARVHWDKCIPIVNNIFARTGVVSVTLPKWMDLFINQDLSASGVTELTINGLERVYGTERRKDNINLQGSNVLTKIVFEDLVDAKGVGIFSCPELVEVHLKNLKTTTINGITVQSNPKLTSLYINSVESIGELDCTGNTSMNWFSLGTGFLRNLFGSVRFRDCALDAGTIKNILLVLKGLDGKNGKCLWGSGMTADFGTGPANGTNAGLAALDAEAIAAKDELIARGATVHLNP